MTPHPDHKKNLDALRRIEGQIRGIQNMIEEKRYCIDILTQISAVNAALFGVQDKILELHLDGCLKGALESESEKERQQKIDEVFELLKRFRKGA